MIVQSVNLGNNPGVDSPQFFTGRLPEIWDWGFMIGDWRGSETFHEFRISNTRIAAQLRIIFPGMDSRVINDVGMRGFIRLFVYVFVDG